MERGRFFFLCHLHIKSFDLTNPIVLFSTLVNRVLEFVYVSASQIFNQHIYVG